MISLGLQRGDHVRRWGMKGVLAGHPRKRDADKSPSWLPRLLSSFHRPTMSVSANQQEVTELPCHWARSSTICALRGTLFELAQVADQAGVLHQPLEMLGAHGHDLLRIEPKNTSSKAGHLASSGCVEAGAEDPQADQRQAVVAHRAQLSGALRLRQARAFQRLPWSPSGSRQYSYIQA